MLDKKLDRNELYMPSERFVTWDDWIPKLSEKVYCLWKRLYTLCDRTDGLGYGVIKCSMEHLAKRLGMSKATLYRLVKPMWNYHLVDFDQYKEWSGGSKPVNLIVYPFPKNDKNLATCTLIKYRDYDTDYDSSERAFAKKGGRPRKDTTTQNTEIPNIPVEQVSMASQEVESDTNDYAFQNENGQGFKNETPSVSEPKPNNMLNHLYNAINLLCNTVNDLSLNITALKNNNITTNNTNTSPSLNSNKEFNSRAETLINSNIRLQYASQFLNDKGWGSEEVNKAICTIYDKGFANKLTKEDVEKCYSMFENSYRQIEASGKQVSCIAGLFVKQIGKRYSLIAITSVKDRVKTVLNEPVVTTSPPFYNWLEA